MSNVQLINALVNDEELSNEEIEILEMMSNEELTDLYQNIITNECLEIIVNV